MVGAGRMANGMHYPSVAAFDDAEIVGIAEMDVERLHGTANRYGVPQELPAMGRPAYSTIDA